MNDWAELVDRYAIVAADRDCWRADADRLAAAARDLFPHLAPVVAPMLRSALAAHDALTAETEGE